jgi:hypothetical protein
MEDRSFESLSRRAAGDGSGRWPFGILSAPGLAAALTGQLGAEATVQASNQKKKKRKKHQQRCPPPVDRCAPQVQTCIAILTAQCGNTASCQDAPPCCALLATCDSVGFFACVVAAVGSS